MTKACIKTIYEAARKLLRKLPLESHVTFKPKQEKPGRRDIKTGDDGFDMWKERDLLFSLHVCRNSYHCCWYLATCTSTIFSCRQCETLCKTIPVTQNINYMQCRTKNERKMWSTRIVSTYHARCTQDVLHVYAPPRSV
jgi:hypothetical protein